MVTATNTAEELRQAIMDALAQGNDTLAQKHMRDLSERNREAHKATIEAEVSIRMTWANQLKESYDSLMAASELPAGMRMVVTKVNDTLTYMLTYDDLFNALSSELDKLTTPQTVHSFQYDSNDGVKVNTETQASTRDSGPRGYGSPDGKEYLSIGKAFSKLATTSQFKTIDSMADTTAKERATKLAAKVQVIEAANWIKGHKVAS